MGVPGSGYQYALLWGEGLLSQLTTRLLTPSHIPPSQSMPLAGDFVSKLQSPGGHRRQEATPIGFGAAPQSWKCVDFGIRLM